uniref:Uncharacterized protein n=1 Tax=Chlamydomonas leiostraca TaxID=1034604 RepID=A0A7S0RT08_9CHLO|mmetsp:Transcript_30841/g.78756  ORF Transcript_30841/g.78756 Transcript_30841/m.78756 type:complete len:196 (+) Transcript_30841:131-718(+)|eukprot:CAMPEP_0202861068 /NCGR_PEP_ID=MMETSP1391-20130828/2590_1 /ASSEMBLY_ACC=CAM_ASM_000867 /TAXON_ID=1034604 /ORGANISM="Chlamydomonas leiostraca, Strain SAG 11-49" /LENGTH=195 /DNA_ID=CAMNT_0049540389 /DNA_START=121 /DNA_END=708 /DNA_ORIENTATION=-
MAKGKVLVWSFWVCHCVLSVVYLGLAITSFSKLVPTTRLLVGEDSSWSSYRNSLLGACFLGFLVVACFLAFSLMVLTGSRFIKDAKLAYGIMLGAAINTAWFQLLAGLVLQTSDPLMAALQQGHIWDPAHYKVYQATFVFSYILCAEYIVAAVVLLFGRRHLGRAELLPLGGATPSLAADPDMARYYDISDKHSA